MLSVRRLHRYWTLWHTLDADERRVRAGGMLERLLRQRPTIRRLGLAADPPSWKRFRRALEVDPETVATRLREAAPRRGPLHGDLEQRAAAIAASHPRHARSTLDQARRLLAGRIDLLGSGERSPLTDDGRLDWHLDWKSGLAWPRDVYHSDIVTVRGDGSDVKLPWELSRFQHLLVLGQAYRLAPHVAGDDESLSTACADAARSQIDDWLQSNPRGIGVNWSCTMDVAIRATVWLAAIGLFRGAEAFDDGFLQRVARSLWCHGRHIRRNLEIGKGGLTSNHYLSDVVGLYAIGCGLPELGEAAGWRALAREAIEREMQRQVHADGVNFERSLPYHRLVAELFVHAALLARHAGEPLDPAFEARLAGMLEFTAAATRQDHTVPQWGDNDDGRLLPLTGYATRRPHDHRHLLVLGGRLLDRADLARAGLGAEPEAVWLLGPAAGVERPAPAVTSRGFADAGYYILAAEDLHCAVACGPVGTCGIGNHSHNDLLSVCIAAAGVEWVIDPGSGSYSGDPQLRNRLRSTAAHATLQLGEREQNAFEPTLDGLFRLDERAHPEVIEWRTGERGARLVARHHGFSGADGRWVHERSIRFDAGARLWQLSDRLQAAPGAPLPDEAVHLRFPLRPGVSCESGAALPEPVGRTLDTTAGHGARLRSALRLADEGGRAFWIGLDLPGEARVTVEAGVYSPRYGVTQPCGVITASWPAKDSSVAHSVLWSPAGGQV